MIARTRDQQNKHKDGAGPFSTSSRTRVPQEGCTEHTLGRRRQGTQRFAVKRIDGSDDVLAIGVQHGHLEGSLNGLRTAVNEEEVRQRTVPRRDLGQEMRGVRPQRIQQLAQKRTK